MIFLHPLPSLEAAVVLYLIVTIIFQVYGIKNSPEYAIRTCAFLDTCITLQSKQPFDINRLIWFGS